MKVIKRDGRTVEFDKDKVISAILKAFESVDGEVTSESEKKAKDIAKHIENLEQDSIDVESIQDMVESMLMSSKRKDVAKAYIIYRNNRTKIRSNKSKLMKEVSEKLTASNVQNQNANIDEKSFGGRIGEVNDVVLKKYALDNCMSEMSRNNHLNNEIYIHDLNYYAIGAHNCLSIPFDKLLANGFNTRQTDVRPAQSVNTAFQLIAVIFQLQSLQQFGGVSATHLDWTMVPYVRKSFYKHYLDGLRYFHDTDSIDGVTKEAAVDVSIDDAIYQTHEDVYKYALDKTEQEVYQGVEGLYHNLDEKLGRHNGNIMNIAA